jgi:hypothetical protein
MPSLPPCETFLADALPPMAVGGPKGDSNTNIAAQATVAKDHGLGGLVLPHGK